MKLLSRAIYQKVILRESALSTPPDQHEVELADIEAFKWNGKKGKIGFSFRIMRFAFCEMKVIRYFCRKLTAYESIFLDPTYACLLFL